VAYADFVTAMMAFFLLLWLLNTTTPEQKLGLAEYFTPTIGVKDAKGIGFRGGKHPNKQGHSKTDLSTPGLVTGQAEQGPIAGNPNRPADAETRTRCRIHCRATKASTSAAESTEDSEQFKEASDDVKQSLEEDPDLKDYQNDVVTQDTPEGLKIDLIDDQKVRCSFPAAGPDRSGQESARLDGARGGQNA